MKKKIIIYLSAICIFLFVSCGKKNRFSIDTNKNRYEITIHRFDRDLLSIDTAHLTQGTYNLYQHYPDFLVEFCTNILNKDIEDTIGVKSMIKEFITDSVFAPMNKKVIELYADISDIQRKVSDAYTYIHHYFPNIQLPELYFFASGFNRQVIMTDKFIGIGVDYYLGSKFPMYKHLTYSYLTDNMNRENLVPDLVSATLFRMFVKNTNENRLLDNMIFRGKVMYLLTVFMPEEKPNVLMGYTPQQMEWCEKFEGDIWTKIIEQKDLFSSDMMLISKYLNEAPFTSTISQESPGRLGTYIGLQIVKSFMDRNKHLTLKNLMDEPNCQKILELSGYHP